MESFLNKSFKDLSDMLEVVATRFFNARKLLSLREDECLMEEDIGNVSDYNQYLNKVFKAFNSLNANERNLINNEFFYQSYHYWWESIYSKATFYRYKKTAMLKFLGAFYHD